jgi:uncharacterized membrane protein YbaN (DUF454 family)
MDEREQERSGYGWARKATGWGLLIAGIAGCILPILPGVPLLLAGLLILARDYVWAKRTLRRVKRWAVKIRRKARSRRSRQLEEARVRAAKAEEF